MVADNKSPRRRRISRPTCWWGIVFVCCVLLLAVSLFIGSNHLSFVQVKDALLEAMGGGDAVESTVRIVVIEQRLPRLVMVVLVGAALATSGALMQSLSRNPLADPGIMGVNAGAALSVVTAVAVFGYTSLHFYLWFGLVGAFAACAVVFFLGGVGGKKGTSARLVLAGVAVTMAVYSLVQLVILNNKDAFNEFRLWAAGSFEGRGWSVVLTVVGIIVVGLVLALICAPGLNALALGDDTAIAMGVNVVRLRVVVMVAIALLSGAATAAVGPIMFIGLGVPFLARMAGGTDMRWVVSLTMIAGPLMLIVADVVARVVIAPQETQTGIVAALIGGPLFLHLVQRRNSTAQEGVS